MNKKMKKYYYLRLFLNTLLLISLVVILLRNFDFSIFELDFLPFTMHLFSTILIFLVVYFILYFFSIIWHEIGHLLFGLKAGLKFEEFSVLKYLIKKRSGKIIINRQKMMPGTLGYCRMFFDENIKYKKINIILYFIGGIVFNYIAIIISFILLNLSSGQYIKYILELNIIINLYFAFYNSMPAMNRFGTLSDMLHLKNYLIDPNYLNMFTKALKIQKLLSSGKNLKDLDENMFLMPKKFNNPSDNFMAIIYIDYIAEKGEHKIIIDLITKLLDEQIDKFSESDINILKLQLLNSVFHANYDVKIIKKYWSDSTKKHIETLGKFYPIVLGYCYMYYNIIEPNESKIKKILDDFEKLRKTHNNKNEIEEAQKIINEVDNKK